MTRVKVSEARAREIGFILSKIGSKAILKLEDSDPQRIACLDIRNHVGEWAPIYAILLALASYRLSVKGEEWWRSYADFVKSRREPSSLSDVHTDIIEFLKTSPGAGFKRDEKIERINRVIRRGGEILEAVRRDENIIFDKASWLASEISRILGSRVESKTIVFAIKMAYYAIREPGEERLVRSLSYLPVDVRVACASYSSGIVESDSYRSLLREQKIVSQAWGIVSRESGIPLLHLDSLLWLTGWAPRDLSLEKARAETYTILSRVTARELALELAEKLYLRECR